MELYLFFRLIDTHLLIIILTELSDVLWTMVFRAAFRSDGYIGAIST